MFAGLLVMAGVVWVFFSLAWALAALVASLLLLFIWHLRNLVKLVIWTREPIGTPTPRGNGLWDFVFASLARRVRVAYDQRERLAQALARFREGCQAMPDGVVYLSRNDIIEWMNQAAERHFGLDAGRDVSAPIANLVRQPDFLRYLEAGEFTEPLVMKLMRQDSLSLMLQVVPFGEDQRMILSRDITQLERLETMRQDFVANVSHELKTPLTVVSGFIEMLHDALEDFSPEDARRYLHLAMEQSTRMQRLIDDLLTLSALETGAPAPLDEQVDVQGLLRGVLQEAQILSAGRHRIECEEGPAASIVGSQKELHSAFANLASNAVRYTPEGGSVRLAWAVVDGAGMLSVADNGIGIAAEHLPRLTERFYRVDRGRSRETGGTGLGLAIVKHILTRHQGALEVESEPGEGSRFVLRFPARRVVLREP